MIESDTSRTQTLKTLLFSEAAVYGGQTLFDQFGDDEQRQTNHLLEDSRGTLQSAFQLLQGRYGPRDRPTSLPLGQSPPSSSSNMSLASTLNSPSPLVRTSSDKSVKALILWSLRDKKKVEAILEKFMAQNTRIQENVKLWCLANQLGVNLPHLKRMQQDDSSKKLGFDIDAALRIAQRDAEDYDESLELDGPGWDLAAIAPKPHQGVFRTFRKDGMAYLQENHAYEPPAWPNRSHSADLGCLDTRTKNRVESLSKLLHQPKEQVFRIPKCIGWKYLAPDNVVAFVFEAQQLSSEGPVSLLQLLFGDENHPTSKPGLGQVFRLALGLATCVAQLHMVGWLHESFRSSNILFFPSATKSASEPTSRSTLNIDFSSPWILGFEFSRLDISRTVGSPDFDPERDIYRHPQRQGDPEVSFTRIHDIYALGVVLLEIGLWQPAIELEKSKFAQVTKGGNIQRHLLKHASIRLESKVGPKYRDIVVKCLTGDFGIFDDNKEDLKLQQAFRSQVVDVLEKAANAL